MTRHRDWRASGALPARRQTDDHSEILIPSPIAGVPIAKPCGCLKFVAISLRYHMRNLQLFIMMIACMRVKRRGGQARAPLSELRYVYKYPGVARRIRDHLSPYS